MLARDALHVGSVRGRYFRENFAQGGIDLVQIIPELVTNADAAIASSGRMHGRIELSFVAPDPHLVASWRAQTRALGVPALTDWRWEVRCRDDGIGVTRARLTADSVRWVSCPSTTGRSAACSAAACAMSGWRRAPVVSRASETNGQSSRGSFRPPAMTPTHTRTSATNPRRVLPRTRW